MLSPLSRTHLRDPRRILPADAEHEPQDRAGFPIKTHHNGLLWMPTVHREGGFRFIIFFKDHEPAHVHVWHAGSMAKITIGDANDPPLVADPGMMRTPELRDAVRIVETRQEQFLTAWREIHGA